MIIDFHTHLFPEEVWEDPFAFAQREPYFGHRLLDIPAKKGRPRLQSEKGVLAAMDREGIDQIVIQGWPLFNHENCVRQNDSTLATISARPGRIWGFCVVNPTAGITARQEVERCAALGFLGVGELDPEGQGFTLDDDDFLRLCDFCVELDLPLALNVRLPMHPYYHNKSVTPLQRYVDLALAKPLLKLVLTHWGGGLPFYELMPDLRRALANVYYDTAGGPYNTEPNLCRATLELAGDEKILFGSGYSPWEGILAPLLPEIQGQVPDEQARANLLYRNAAQLLGLPSRKEE